MLTVVDVLLLCDREIRISKLSGCIHPVELLILLFAMSVGKTKTRSFIPPPLFLSSFLAHRNFFSLIQVMNWSNTTLSVLMKSYLSHWRVIHLFRPTIITGHSDISSNVLNLLLCQIPALVAQNCQCIRINHNLKSLRQWTFPSNQIKRNITIWSSSYPFEKNIFRIKISLLLFTNLFFTLLPFEVYYECYQRPYMIPLLYACSVCLPCWHYPCHSPGEMYARFPFSKCVHI